MAANKALEAALALACDPRLAAAMRQHPLPEGVAGLLAFLADEQLDDSEPLMHAMTPEVGAVIERYIYEVLLFPGASPQRVLGVDEDNRARARQHMKLLLKWLHPDFAGDDWRAALARRVVDAWKDFSNSSPTSKDGERALKRTSSFLTPSPRHATRRRRGHSPVAWIVHPGGDRAAQSVGVTKAIVALSIIGIAALIALLVWSPVQPVAFGGYVSRESEPIDLREAFPIGPGRR